MYAEVTTFFFYYERRIQSRMKSLRVLHHVDDRRNVSDWRQLLQFFNLQDVTSSLSLKLYIVVFSVSRTDSRMKSL
jgi:hypothetical protein